MAGYTYPPEIWTPPLTGAELVQIYAGSVYQTAISLSTLLAFIGSAGVPLATVDPHVVGAWWNNGGFLCISNG